MNYRDLNRQILQLNNVLKIGTITTPQQTYPFYKIEAGSGPHNILLTAAIHGNEPAGALALTQFCNKHLHNYTTDFSFCIYPCLNPHGFDHSTRGNFNNANLNREFKPDTQEPEIGFIKNTLKDSYIFTMDLHETLPITQSTTGEEPNGNNPDGFFLWELCDNKEKRIGQKIIDNVTHTNLPICTWKNIYDDSAHNGVISYPEGCGTPAYASDTVFDMHLKTYYTNHAFTIETPINYSLEQRIQGHITSILTALEEYTSTN